MVRRSVGDGWVVLVVGLKLKLKWLKLPPLAPSQLRFVLRDVLDNELLRKNRRR